MLFDANIRFRDTPFILIFVARTEYARALLDRGFGLYYISSCRKRVSISIASRSNWTFGESRERTIDRIDNCAVQLDKPRCSDLFTDCQEKVGDRYINK